MTKIKKPRSNPSKHYVNNKQLYAALVDYRKALKRARNLPIEQRPPIPKYVGECIMLLCSRLSLSPNFSRYTYREDMIGDGIENCVAAVKNFDPNKTNNPFGYFTQVARNAFIRRIQREKKQSYVKAKNYENAFIEERHAVGAADSELQKPTNINVDAFIADFERTMSKTVQRGKKKVVVKSLS